jgi:hypothetical protein
MGAWGNGAMQPRVMESMGQSDQSNEKEDAELDDPGS